LKRAIIFGIRRYSNVIEKMIETQDTTIIGYSDFDTRLFLDNEKSYYKVEELNSLQFDYLFIGCYPFISVYKRLIDLGIETNKIINAVSYYNSYIHFNALHLKSPVDLFVTGLSYAYGIPVQLLNDNAVNLAYPGQDLLLDYSIAQYLIHNHRGQIPRYAVIGLAYYSFNYEFIQTQPRDDEYIRLSRMSLWPGLVGRYYHMAQYANSNYLEHLHAHKVSEIGKYLEHTKLFISPLDKPFHDVNMVVFNKDQISRVQKKELDLESRWRVAEKISNKDYPQSIENNIAILRSYLQLLTDHNIKPILVVHPQHPEFVSKFSSRMKEQFRSIMDSLRKQYNFQLIDSFESNLMGDMDFKDPDHLDAEAQVRFTQYLRSTINWND
jgi:hypothetical protein